jgi:hypothetical protein
MQQRSVDGSVNKILIVLANIIKMVAWNIVKLLKQSKLVLFIPQGFVMDC